MCVLCMNKIHHGELPVVGSIGQGFISRLLGDTRDDGSNREFPMPTNSGSVGKKIIIRGADILTMDPLVGDFEGGDLLIDGSTILAVGQRIDCTDAEIVDARGKILMPGFIDTHHHQFETALRSTLSNGSLVDDGSPTGKLNYLSYILGTLAPTYRPEDVYISELFGSLSQLDAGVTTVFDVSQIHYTPEHSDAAVAALRDAGRRSVMGYFEGAGSHSAFPGDAKRLRKEHFSSDDALVTMIMGGEIFLPEWEKSWEIARELELRTALHVVGSMGLAPAMESIAAQGLLTDKHLLIHMTGMSDTTWKAVRDAGSSISLAVPIEMTMRHGMPPILKSLELGILPSLSSDVECTLTADFFTQMRAALTLQRGLVHEMALNGNPDTPELLTVRKVIEFATVGGAKALGMDQRIGTLSVGKAADLILLDADAINVAPLNNVPGAVVTLMERSNVNSVFVDGKIKKWNGRLLGVDLAQLLSAINKSRDGIFERAGVSKRIFD